MGSLEHCTIFVFTITEEIIDLLRYRPQITLSKSLKKEKGMIPEISEKSKS